MKKLPLLFLVLALSCSTPNQVDLLITNVHIIDVENGEVSKNQMIAISDNRIIAVDEASNSANYMYKEIMDGDGTFAMPGLWDNHVHFRGGENLIEQNKAMLPMFLAFGVTTVRDGGGDITPAIRDWQTEIENGELAGPTIFTPGPKIDGSNPAWDGSIKVLAVEDALTALESLEGIFADFVKIYDGNLSPDAYYAVITEAEARGLKVTGHMPLSADLITAANLGLDGIEHLYYALTETALNADEIQQENPGYAAITPLMDNYNAELANQTYAQLAESQFYVTPTLHIGRTLAELNITDHSNDSLLAYMSPEIVDTYQRRIRSAARGGEIYTNQRQRWGEAFRAMVKPMHDAGIHILAGSDCGPFNSYVYPGASIHEELEELVNAGLSPPEALSTSIINGPRFFDLEDKYGSLEAGKVADIILLKENPLENISHTKSVIITIKNGTYYSTKNLRQQLNSKN
ncbi:MAG: amidohydrolase family protein [Balneolaceae bacterium]|nr:amidohydrolase family protein [Balneolaceae bacterium]